MTREAIRSGQASLPSTNPTASFWHTQPSKLLLSHRTTEHLPKEADVVIIGSGITGAFAAHYIDHHRASKGLNVVMLEAREACWGATGRVRGFLLSCIAFRYLLIVIHYSLFILLFNFLLLKVGELHHEYTRTRRT